MKTQANLATYPIPKHALCVTAEICFPGNVVIPLMAIDKPTLDTLPEMVGTPTYAYGSLGTLTVWPTPDKEYEIVISTLAWRH